MRPSLYENPTRRVKDALPYVTLLLLPSVAGAQLGLWGYNLWIPGVHDGSRVGEAVAVGDFDGNGYDDMAVGAPFYDFIGSEDSGRIYLRSVGLGGSVFSSSLAGCLGPDDPEDHAHLGAAVAFGDFDGDGDEDLAVGMPGATSGGVVGAGAVCIVSGGLESLVPSSRTRISKVDLGAVPGPGAEFGAALATGDLNADGFADLAIGSPGEGVEDGFVVSGAGAVYVLFGGLGGLGTDDAEVLHRGLPSVSWDPAPFENFGAALAIGDFHAGFADDLVVGAPGDHPTSIGGSVTLFHGQVGGTIGGSSVSMTIGGGFWDLLGVPEPGDRFGGSLVSGDFDGDNDIDLAVGIPMASDPSVELQSGAVMVIYRDETSLTDEGEQVFTKASLGSAVNPLDRFGSVLAAGDFNLDGSDDLAIGAPYDDFFAMFDAGDVTVLYGSAGGLQEEGLQLIDMVFLGGPQAGDRFGSSLASGKLFGASGGDDLMIGIPGRRYSGEDIFEDNGAVAVVQSAVYFSDGFDAGGSSAWSSSSP